MDFFAAGGFQQLFNDLDEQQVQLELETDVCSNMAANMANDADVDFYAATTTTLTMATDIYNDTNSNNSNDNNSSDDSNCSNSNDLYDDAVLLTQATTEARYELLLNADSKNDYNNDYNNNDDNSLFESQLEKCLNYLLPLERVHEAQEECSNEVSASRTSDDIFDLMSTQSSCLIADWEMQFLDNYIEIPELVDFLPEKTPLCTDNCALFLQESSQHLRLYRKHRTKSAAAVAAASDASKSYACTFGACQKLYAKPAHLKAHLRRHLGEKPYICTWPSCTWKFSRSDELARHRRSHSGVKPYKCDYCNKCFARSDHLAKHRKVHERRLLAANKAGHGGADGMLPSSVLHVRPGRKRKNQFC